MKLKDLIYMGLAIALVGSYIYSINSESNVGGISYPYSCITTTSTVVDIGADLTTQVLPARSGRAYAMIQQVKDSAGLSTSTVSINFGATATLAGGIELATTSGADRR